MRGAREELERTFKAQVDEPAQNKPQGRNSVLSRDRAFSAIHKDPGRNQDAQTRQGELCEDFQCRETWGDVSRDNYPQGVVGMQSSRVSVTHTGYLDDSPSVLHQVQQKTQTGCS